MFVKYNRMNNNADCNIFQFVPKAEQISSSTYALSYGGSLQLFSERKLLALLFSLGGSL